jgi:hypothetical protein
MRSFWKINLQRPHICNTRLEEIEAMTMLERKRILDETAQWTYGENIYKLYKIKKIVRLNRVLQLSPCDVIP